MPKHLLPQGKTLHSRNSLIGRFTERWCKKLFGPIAKNLGLHAVNGVVCEELGLAKYSPADLALCTTEEIIQKAQNIKLLFEIKRGIVSNYKYIPPNKIEFVGDYQQHQGNPSLLRSDSMLKAIGKSINIRIYGQSSRKIPIIVLGNSPITKNYIDKVDFLKKMGVIQGFWSLNPKPTNSEFIKTTPQFEFKTIMDTKQLFENCKELVSSDMNYFSSRITKEKLGEIIRIANQERTDIAKAEKFLSLIES